MESVYEKIVVLLQSVRRNVFSAPDNRTFVHLFEWKWPDVAKECERFIGPKGYHAIQVSPPQEHIQGSQWWTRYQPVSYKLISRGGTREQFADMVRRCKAVGVDIYVDAVINHMSGTRRGRGVGGSRYRKYRYPSVPYCPSDFHYCGRNRKNVITNYQDAYEVRNCELLKLADLATEKENVRQKISNYLNDLINIGVAGFRFDAAKHMEPRDLSNISQRLKGRPFIFQEVIEDSREPIRAREYFGIGSVTEFKFGRIVGEHVRDNKMKYLKTFGEGWGLVPSKKSVPFICNHDTERIGHGGGLAPVTFRERKLFELAHVFMLAWPYGYPKVLSSYEFGNNSNLGPPSRSPYKGNKIRCGPFHAWKCQHRWIPIANMVKFRKVAGSSPVGKWWARDGAIAFARRGKAFVLVNRDQKEVVETFDTGLPPGTYCNVITGELENGKCAGSTVNVGTDRRALVRVPKMSAAAIHVGEVEF